MTETSTSMPSRLAAAPAYISQAAASTGVGRHGRCGAGVYWDIASAGERCGHGGGVVPCGGHRPGRVGTDGGTSVAGGPEPDLGAPPRCRPIRLADAIRV